MNKKNIPTTDYGYIDYNDSILIIKVGGGNTASFQYNGTRCYNETLKGRVIEQFESDCKWFNSSVWYNKTVWGSNYPSHIYFNKDNDIEMVLRASQRKLDNIADKKAKPTKNILESIIKEVNKNCKLNYSFPYDCTDYGVHWYEAYIPLSNGNDNFILTWKNCD